MQKGKVIDFVNYCDQDESNSTSNKHSISAELEQAIQHLIYRLRELGPMSGN